MYTTYYRIQIERICALQAHNRIIYTWSKNRIHMYLYILAAVIYTRYTVQKIVSFYNARMMYGGEFNIQVRAFRMYIRFTVFSLIYIIIALSIGTIPCTENWCAPRLIFFNKLHRDNYLFSKARQHRYIISAYIGSA